MSDMKFQINDRVRWGTAEGVVETLTVDSSIVVNFKGRRLWFKADCSIFSDLPGQPLLELIERPKKTRKVKVWRWERVMKYGSGWCLMQTENLYLESDWDDKEGWTKVPGSEREIECDLDE